MIPCKRAHASKSNMSVRQPTSHHILHHITSCRRPRTFFSTVAVAFAVMDCILLGPPSAPYDCITRDTFRDTIMNSLGCLGRKCPDSMMTVTYTLMVVFLWSILGFCCCLQVEGLQGVVYNNHPLVRPPKYSMDSSFCCLKVYKDDDESYFQDDGNYNQVAPGSASSSTSFAMDPTSDTARRILRDTLQLSSEQHQQLAKLAVLVNDWNSNINLISRKDCSRDVVFGRHILPSLAPLSVLSVGDNDNYDALQLFPGQYVCDVGTGGGFPGLPLAIARPDVNFMLVDSVGKKIQAVQDMADQLGLQNVETFHGRAESLPATTKKFDWVMGRSVAAIPTYCFWIDHLLKKKSRKSDSDGDCGHLVYLIGGDIDEAILDYAVQDEKISTLLDCPDVSDKRVLVFPQPAVQALAVASGEKLRVPARGSGKGGARPGRNKNRRSGAKAKGQWQRRDTSAPKQRGYQGFQRYDSLQSEK